MTTKTEITYDQLDRILRLMGTTEGRRTIRKEIQTLLAAPAAEPLVVKLTGPKEWLDELRAVAAATCAECHASTADACNQNGCGYLESGNGAPAVERQEPIGEVTYLGEDYARVGLYDVGKLKANDLLYTSPPVPVSLEVTHDRAYRNGLMAGFNFGISGNEKGYAKAVARYDAEIHAAKLEQSAPVAVVLPELTDEQRDIEVTEMADFMNHLSGGLRHFAGYLIDAGWRKPNACLDKVKELNTIETPIKCCQCGACPGGCIAESRS